MNSHDNICCSLTVTEFIIMIVLLIVLIITIISIIVCYKKKLACFKEKKESENKAIEVSKKDN